MMKQSPLSQPIALKAAWIGAGLGLVYGLVDTCFLDTRTHRSALILIMHEFVDFVLPVVLGFVAGLGLAVLRVRTRLIQRMSIQHSALQRDLLFHTMLSQILHEIRNPLHNILAALDAQTLPDREQKELILRNLARLESLKKNYDRDGSLLDRIDLQESTPLHEWFRAFREDGLDFQLRQSRIALRQDIRPCRVQIHPLLLEQIFTTLVNNAIEAAQTAEGTGWLQVTASDSGTAETPILIQIRNNGRVFPQEALEKNGKLPLSGTAGLGLGLVLARRLVEQAGARMALVNQDGHATVRLLLRGSFV